jgi:hypothetical protein
MAVGRAPLWLLVAAPGVVVIVLAVRDLFPSAAPADQRPAAAVEPHVPAELAPAPANASDADATDSRCVAPPCDDRVSGAQFNLWRGPGVPPASAITGSLVDSNGRSVEGRPPLRCWSTVSVLSTWTRDGGSFVLENPSPGTEYDVDVVFPGDQFPGRRDGRFHVGTLRAGDRDVTLRLPVAFAVVATGTLVDERGRALAGWSVFAHRRANGISAPDPFAESTTDGEGRFTVRAWTRSDFTLGIRTPAGGLRRATRSELVAGTADVRVTAGAPMIGGAVAADLGASPAGAIVRLRDVATGAERRVEATRDGGFAFEDVDEHATYELSAELAGHVSVVPTESVTDRSDPRVRLTAVGRLVAGTATDARDRPLRFAWLRFFTTDRSYAFQTLTDVDGRFASAAAWPAEFDVFLLAPGPDGRLVPGPKVGRCRGGDRNLQLRASR